MKRLVSAILAGLLSSTLLAQGDRITFGTAPVPDQTFHIHSTQEVAMTTSVEAPTADASTPVVLVSFVFDSTAAIGPRDGDGHYAGRMTIDRVSTTATLNGNLRRDAGREAYCASRRLGWVVFHPADAERGSYPVKSKRDATRFASD
jgi:hypothetical protein